MKRLIIFVFAFCLSGLAQTNVRGNNGTFTGNVTVSGGVTAQGGTSVTGQWTDPRFYGAKCDDSTDDTAAFNSAITATAIGGTVLVPQTSNGTGCLISGAGTEILLLTNAKNLRGFGLGSTLLVKSTVGASTDVIRIQGTAGQQFLWMLSDFAIQVQSGTPARYGINIDSTSNPISNLLINHIFIGALGNNAIHSTNPTSANGFFTSTISNSYLSNGISLQRAGDSINIIGNTIPGLLTGVDVSSVPGADSLYIAFNNITTKAGLIHLGNDVLAPRIVHNNLEALPVSETGSNGALVDCDGSSGHVVESLLIEGNYINAISQAFDLVRVNFCNLTATRNNRMQNPGGANVTYRLTVNSTKNMPGPDDILPYGSTVAAVLSDSSADGLTAYSSETSAWTVPANGFIQFLSSGVPGPIFQAAEGARFGSTMNYGFSSNANPALASADSNISRIAAGVIGSGNGTQGNTSGSFKAASFISGGALATLSGTGACATITTQTGGSMAGRATCTGATAASTLTIQPGTTAPNGWVCYVQDQTTRANLLQQTSTTATACTLTATSVTQNDVFVFTAIAF